MCVRRRRSGARTPLRGLSAALAPLHVVCDPPTGCLFQMVMGPGHAPLPTHTTRSSDQPLIVRCGPPAASKPASYCGTTGNGSIDHPVALACATSAHHGYVPMTDACATSARHGCVSTTDACATSAHHGHASTADACATSATPSLRSPTTPTTRPPRAAATSARTAPPPLRTPSPPTSGPGGCAPTAPIGHADLTPAPNRGTNGNVSCTAGGACYSVSRSRTLANATSLPALSRRQHHASTRCNAARAPRLNAP